MFNNWIEEYFQKEIAWRPICVGSRGGRKYYAVTFEDGTEGAYFIDWENHTIEPF